MTIPTRTVRAVVATLLLVGIAAGIPAAPAIAATPHFLTLPIANTHGMHIQQAWLWSGGARDGSAGHDGIDYIKAKVDSAPVTWKSFRVVAAAPGRACASRNGRSACGFASRGNWVVMRHRVEGRTWYTFYGHLRTIDPAIPLGRWSDAGLVRGHSLGMSGYSGDPCCITHLHFELLTGPGHRVDPYGLYARRERYPDPAGKNGRRSASANAWITNPPTPAHPHRTTRPVVGHSTPPTPSGSHAPQPAISPDPAFGAFPVPADSVPINAQEDTDTSDASPLAAWHSPLDATGTVTFFLGLTSGRWLPVGPPSGTPLGVDLTLGDGDGTYAHAAVTVTAEGSGSRISVRLVPLGELPVSSPTVEASGDLTSPTPLPPSLAPGSLPAWATPDGATVLHSATVGSTVFVVLSAVADPAALLDTYDRALKDAGLAHTVHSDRDSVVITIADEVHPGTIVLAPDSAGSRVALGLTP